jgi:hypothetical protein
MPDTEHLDEDKRCTLFDKRTKFCQRCSEFHTEAEWGETCERYMGAAAIRQCKTCGGWHALDRWNDNCRPEPNWNRSDHPSPHYISDSLPDIMNPLTGEPIDSKRALRKQYREAGVEEVGDQEQKRVITETSEREIAMDVKRTLETLKSDNMSNDQVANMLRAPAPENALGLGIQ